jgi:hypothetical protein
MIMTKFIAQCMGEKKVYYSCTRPIWHHIDFPSVIAGLTIAVLCLLFSGGPVCGEDKISIGIAEDVILLPWGVTLPARIDTGAATTSLDARDLEVKDDIAEFTLPHKYGGTKIIIPVKHWKAIRSATGRQRRPIVEMIICVGPKKLLTEVNLVNRSKMKYPLIIGRNVLKEGFVVDCLCTNILKPSCSGAETK